MTQLQLKYSGAQKRVTEKIEKLKTVIAEHEKRFKKEDKNWGYFGDLNAVEQDLDNILERFVMFYDKK